MLSPTSIEDAVALLGGAWRDSTPTVVVDRLDPTDVVAPGVTQVTLRGLNRIVRIDRENLAVIVEAGVTARQLRQSLDATGLWCPAVRWLPDDETLGCAVAGGHGRRSRAYGAVVDYLLGTRFVCPAVGPVRHGSLAIKNATGYNLTGCVAGSRGAFAAVLEATLRLVPRPARHVVRRYRVQRPDVGWSLGMQLARPGALMPGGGTGPSSAAALEIWTSLEGHQQLLQIECDDSRVDESWSSSLGSMDALDEADADHTGSWPPTHDSPRTTMRFATDPARVDDVVARARHDFPADADGWVLAELTGGSLELTLGESSAATVSERRAMTPAPDLANASALRRRLKAAFDPGDLLWVNSSRAQTEYALDVGRR